MKEKIPRDSLEEGLKEDMYMDGWEGGAQGQGRL